MQHGQLRNVPERRRLFGVAPVPKRDRGHVRHPEQPTPFWDVAELPVLHVPSAGVQ